MHNTYNIHIYIHLYIYIFVVYIYIYKDAYGGSIDIEYPYYTTVKF